MYSRKIVSTSRDNTVYILNTIGKTKKHLKNQHKDWVTCCEYSPDINTPILATGSLDNTVKNY